MGNIIPLDQAKKQEIEDLASEFLATFAIQFPLAYGVELTKAKLKEMDQEAFGEAEKEKELKYREKIELKEPRKMGYLIKQGAVVKNWKKRFFVVNPDYSIDYFENEEAYQKGFKAKGCIFPSGYTVEEDADSSILDKLKKVAKAMGIDESELPQPDKYPEHTFEIAHERRRKYYITAENEEEKKDWIKMFELCCSKAKGFKNQDPVMQQAFIVAHKRARSESGMWPYSRSGGTEEQVLSDSIVELIDGRVMGSVYSNLTGGYIIRKKVREQVVKMLDSMVMAMVLPSYKGLLESTMKMKGPMEEAIDGKKDEIVGVQQKITSEMADKLDGMLQEHVQDLVEDIEKLEPQIREVVNKTLPLLREKTVVRLMDEITNRAKDNDNIEKSLPEYFRLLDKVKASSWPDQYWQTYNAIKEIMSVVYNSNEEFKSYPDQWGKLVYGSLDILIDVVDGAFFTFEELFQELVKGTDAMTNGKTAADAMVTAKDQVLPKYDHDVKAVPGELSLKHTIDVVVYVISSKIDPLTKDLRKTLGQTIPKAVEQIVSIEDRYQLFVEQSVGKLVKKILGIPVSSPSSEKTAEEKPVTDL